MSGSGNISGNMIEGILLKGYGGFYYVYAEGRVWECSLRGRFRIRDQEFFPGDRVEILPAKSDKAVIEKVKERRNSLVRPTIANVDQAFLVFALTSPKPDLNLLDRLLIQVTDAGVSPVIVFTKLDLWKEAESLEGEEVRSGKEKSPGTEDKGIQENVMGIYENIGYKVLAVSNKTKRGIPGVVAELADKISVLAGPSGVGKSSLLNALSPELALKTGDVSRKLARGRHTTRHVELMVAGGGLVADTPGFSVLNLPAMKREELPHFFPEFEAFLGHCRFKSCLHDQEPDCAVKEALAQGKIAPSRYEHYQTFLHEVIAAERRY